MSITCSWHDFRAYLFRSDLRLTGLCSVNEGIIIWKKTNSATDKDIGLLYRVMMSQSAEYLENGAVFANERRKLCRPMCVAYLILLSSLAFIISNPLRWSRQDARQDWKLK